MGHAKQTAARLVDQRARRRATQTLIEIHRDEFNDLYARHREQAEIEAEALAISPQAAAHYHSAPVRLQPGTRQPGQKAGDRIDVARCAHCIKHHDRNHVCAKCGAVPNHALTIPEDGERDDVAIERAMQGEAIRLTSSERAEAARRLARRGLGPGQIAATLRMSASRVHQVIGERQ